MCHIKISFIKEIFVISALSFGVFEGFRSMYSRFICFLGKVLNISGSCVFADRLNFCPYGALEHIRKTYLNIPILTIDALSTLEHLRKSLHVRNMHLIMLGYLQTSLQTYPPTASV